MVVKRTPRKTYLMFALIIALSIILGSSLAAVAQEEEDLTPTMEEEYVVELNDVGDGHITDTITYDDEDYEIVKEIAEESKGFLTRRYTAVDNVGELVDFNTEFDDDNSSVVITYDMPGFAYNTEGSWMVLGFQEEPDKESDLIFTTTNTYTINSEFTLFTDQVLETKTTIKLPESAANAVYDPNEKAITYETDPPESTLGFFSENRTVLMIVFGLLCALFLGLLIFVSTRKTAAPVAGQAAVLAPGTLTDTNVPATEGGATTPAYTQTTVSGEEAVEVVEEVVVEETRVFCTSCGHEIPAGKQFCMHCGKQVKS